MRVLLLRQGKDQGMFSLALAAFALGTAGNLFKGVPQFTRTAVRGQVAGLAPSAVWLAAVANVLWLCFGIAIRDTRFVVLSALGTLLTAGTLARFVSATDRRLHQWRGTAAFAAVLALSALAALDVDNILAALGTVLGVGLSLPQLLYLWRRRHEQIDVSGVSRVEYAVVIAAQVGWTTYWLTQTQYLVAVGAAWGGLARIATLLLVRWHSQRAPAAAAA
jgi:uncharacterized protein with PQ loop repeat